MRNWNYAYATRCKKSISFPVREFQRGFLTKISYFAVDLLFICSFC